jgi:rubrerythrin
MNKLFQKKHELFLSMLFGAFSISNDDLFDILYDFAFIEYRHLNWLGTKLAEEKQEFNFDYERANVKFEAKDNFELFTLLKKQLEDIRESYQSDGMFDRFVADEEYFIQKIDVLLKNEKNNQPITAFSKKRVLEGYELDKTSTDALTQFLFEETYKEYELVMVYSYSNFYTDSKVLSNIFIDLIYESFFHLKSFARMLSRMGILYLPRQIVQSVYKFDDLKQFLLDGIEEEKMAKEECIKLSQAVKNEELSNFFNFINNQENYHIELMQKALKYTLYKKWPTKEA